MGQDDRCGICNKHYQECPHYRKEHIARPDNVGPLCGGEPAGGYFSFSCDSDPDNVCRRCIKAFLKMGQINFGLMCLSIQENL